MKQEQLLHTSSCNSNHVSFFSDTISTATWSQWRCCKKKDMTNNSFWCLNATESRPTAIKRGFQVQVCGNQSIKCCSVWQRHSLTLLCPWSKSNYAWEELQLVLSTSKPKVTWKPPGISLKQRLGHIAQGEWYMWAQSTCAAKKKRVVEVSRNCDKFRPISFKKPRNVVQFWGWTFLRIKHQNNVKCSRVQSLFNWREKDGTTCWHNPHFDHIKAKKK